jgi:oxygen-dependent protoporphyrinogen oxidase
MTRRVAVVGGGISGVTAALELAEAGVEVDLYEAGERLGGRIATSPFAGLPHVDEGADAFLARVPEAVALARRVGLGDDLVSPEPVGAAVWHDRMHPIPDGLVLGLPGRLGPLATTGLLSWRGKLRAACEPLLPATSTAPDAVGAFVRARFGDEVHERLVDALVGSIYATDTDRFSLAEVPQLAALAAGGRSVMLSARRQRTVAGTATAAAGAVFATPRAGVAALTAATATAAEHAGATIHPASPVERIERVDGGWSVNAPGGQRCVDAVILATPAEVTATMIGDDAPEAARLLRTAERADVIMVTLHVAADQWPVHLRSLSGYLVPKPVQRAVTAVSFGSQKWAHWRPPSGGEVLRVSLGRDGAPVLHLDDDDVLDAVLADLGRHLGIDLAPLDVRINRWPGAFAQYRPHHRAWVQAVDDALPAHVAVTGASYRGIGIPACVRDATATARRVLTNLARLEES